MKIDRRAAIIGATFIGLAIAVKDVAGESPIIPAAPADEAGLRARADRKGLLMGAAVLGKSLMTDPLVRTALREDANILVPEIELKWDTLQPQLGAFNFEPFRPILEFANANAMKLRGHTLTWYRAIPQWAREAIPNLSAAAAGDMLENFIGTVVGHYRGQVAHWDVANEAIDGRKLITEPLWNSRLGERYLDIAFHAAHRADPDALLVFNTDLIEMDHHYHEAHRIATLELLERLVKHGVPVHALGIEGHIVASETFNETIYRKFLDDVTALGLKLVVTEFDVSDRGVEGTIDARDQAVAAVGKAFLDVNFSYEQCLGLLTWSLSDRYSWLRNEPDRQRTDLSPIRGGLLDVDFRRKPLWTAVARAIDAAPMRKAPA